MHTLEYSIRAICIGDCAGFSHVIEQLSERDDIELVDSGADDLAPVSGADVVLLAAAADESVVASALDRVADRAALPIVLVVPTATPQILDSALLHAAFDVVTVDAPPAAIAFSLRRAAASRAHRPPAPGMQGRSGYGQVVSVFSTKGGVGTTTIAANMAAAAVARLGVRTLLVDLDLTGGDATLLFGMQPTRTIIDIALGQGDLDPGKLEGFVTRHASGLEVLAAPIRQQDAQLVRAERVHDVIGVARESYGLVVVDLQRHLDDNMLAALDRSSDVLVVASPDIASVRSAHTSMEMLADVRFPEGRTRLVMNRAGSSVGMSLGEIERVLHQRARYCIPSDRLVPLSANQGTPVVLSHPGSRIGTSITQLARGVLAEAGTPSSGGPRKHGPRVRFRRRPAGDAARSNPTATVKA